MNDTTDDLLRHPLTHEELELIEQLAICEARSNPWAFRQYVYEDFLRGWWQHDLSLHLMSFWRAMNRRQRPVLLIMAPPQHGKTKSVLDFAGWALGQSTSVASSGLKVMYTSFSRDLCQDANAQSQRLLDNPRYIRVFPRTRLVPRGREGEEGARRTSSQLDIVNAHGSPTNSFFRCTTVGGQINGKGFHLGIIDDPLKGFEAAHSLTIRDKTWGWMMNDFFTRFDKYAGIIFIMTRWHVDDPIGRWIEHFPHVKVVKYPAIAIEDEPYRKKGEPLFPEHKPLDFLLERKLGMSEPQFEALYQQSPYVVGGGMFPIERIEVIDYVPRDKIRRSIRYWDKAGTEDGGAWTAGVLMHHMVDDTYIIEDVVRGQWASLEREQIILRTSRLDKTFCKLYDIWIEQEPGSGGKESAENTVRMLRGFTVYTDKVTDPKEVRADPYSAQVQHGNIKVVAGPWVRGFLEEHENFPSGKTKDRVDATAGAFNKLTGTNTWDALYKGKAWADLRGRYCEPPT